MNTLDSYRCQSLEEQITDGNTELLDHILHGRQWLTDSDEDSPWQCLLRWLDGSAVNELAEYLDQILELWLKQKLGKPLIRESEIDYALLQCFRTIDHGTLRGSQRYLARFIPQWRSWLAPFRSLGLRDVEFTFLELLANNSDYLSALENTQVELLWIWYNLCELNQLPELRYAAIGLRGLYKSALPSQSADVNKPMMRLVSGITLLITSLNSNFRFDSNIIRKQIFADSKLPSNHLEMAYDLSLSRHELHVEFFRSLAGDAAIPKNSVILQLARKLAQNIGLPEDEIIAAGLPPSATLAVPNTFSDLDDDQPWLHMRPPSSSAEESPSIAVEGRR